MGDDITVVRCYDPSDQERARALILEGLKEHWGQTDPSLNRDLDDIATTYKDGLFLVACRGLDLIATGALVRCGDCQAEIVRMSVARSSRRTGVGSLVLRHLVHEARRAGYREIVLETTSTWKDAIHFYLKHGFRVLDHRGGNTYFVLDLATSEGSALAFGVVSDDERRSS